jgi:hypothetical protein
MRQYLNIEAVEKMSLEIKKLTENGAPNYYATDALYKISIACVLYSMIN